MIGKDTTSVFEPALSEHKRVEGFRTKLAESAALAAGGTLLKPVRALSPRGTYFVTFSTWQRRRLFVVESYSRLFLKTLYGYRREKRFELHAFVVMPEHVHLLLTPGPEITLERAIQFIKGGYSHALRATFNRPGEVWQRGFTDHRIRDSADFEDHRRYIHENPVRRGLVESSADYRYSSAFPGFKLDFWPSAAEAA
jgi:putative transposase